MSIEETIANMTRESIPGMLLSNVTIIGADTDQNPSVDHPHMNIVLALLRNNQYLWCYRRGHPTIYGTFYMGTKVQRIDRGGGGGGGNGDDNALIFALPNENQQMRFAIKWVSIQRYREKGMNMQEDPYNEIKIKSHICRFMRHDQIINSGIIIPIGVVSNETQVFLQGHGNISGDGDGDDHQRYFFILSQLANGGDLFDAVTGSGDMDIAGDGDADADADGDDNNGDNRLMDIVTIRHLFRQMVRAIHCLHQIRVFHRDLSVENFVIHNGNDSNNDSSNDQRIYVIDFGQARIVDPNDGDIFRHDNKYFGKPSYTPPELIQGHINLHWKKVDIWALGITLYYMLLRQLPHWSVSNGECCLTNVNDPSFQLFIRQGMLATWIRRSNAAIPDEVLEVLQGMLQEDPTRRLSTEEILNHPWLVAS